MIIKKVSASQNCVGCTHTLVEISQWSHQCCEIICQRTLDRNLFNSKEREYLLDQCNRDSRFSKTFYDEHFKKYAHISMVFLILLIFLKISCFTSSRKWTKITSSPFTTYTQRQKKKKTWKLKRKEKDRKKENMKIEEKRKDTRQKKHDETHYAIN